MASAMSSHCNDQVWPKMLATTQTLEVVNGFLRGYAGSFALKNLQNHNTIIFAMTLSQCRNSGLSDLCV